MNQRHSSLRSVAIALLVVAATTSPSGAQPTGSVDPFNGAFTTDVPITVPDFRGITPTLRLTYNSAIGNGWAGVGWSLAGVSYIYRRGPDEGMPTYGPNDTFYLDGAELVPCTTQGGTHCTYIQNYARIKDEGDGTWTVRGTNGNLATYEALISTSGGTYRWAITSLQDPNGNVVTYEYWCDGSPQPDDCYPDSISYGGGAQILFHSEPRPDLIQAGRGPSFGLTRHRLRSIEVRAGSPQETARAYQLTYAQSADTGRSIVQSIQQFGRGAVVAPSGSVTGPALPPMTLSYPTTGAFPGEGGAGEFSDPPCDPALDPWDPAACPGILLVDPVQNSDPLTVGERSAFGDFNGDGRLDSALFYPAETEEPGISETAFFIALAAGTPEAPFHEAIGWGGPPSYPSCVLHAQAVRQFSGADVDGDGRSDIVLLCKMATPNPGPLQVHTWRTQPDLSFEHSFVATTETYDIESSKWLPLDVNGDGKVDIVTLKRTASNWTDVRVGYGVGDGTFSWSIASAPNLYWPMKNISWSAGDFNGDGRADLASIHEIPNTTGGIAIAYALANADGSFSTGSQSTSLGVYPDARWPLNVAPADLNGDGLGDLVFAAQKVQPGYFGDLDLVAILSKGTPTGSSLFEVDEDVVLTNVYGVDQQTVGDLNADGKSEVVLQYDVSGANDEYLTLFRREDGTYASKAAPELDVLPLPDMGTVGAIGDYSGDGVGDLVRIGSSLHSYYQAFKFIFVGQPSLAQPDLVASLENGIGGSTDIDYVASSQWSDPTVNQYLPPGFSIPTVEAVTTSDGRGNSGTSAYTYEGALWSIDERQFMGFRRVTTVVDGTGATQETVYYQVEGTVAKPEQTTIYDGSGNIIAATQYTYTPDPDGLPPFNSLLGSKWDYECNGTTSLTGCRVILTQFGYDIYGNVTATFEHGRYINPGNQDLGDERVTVRVYGLDPSASPSSYIVGLPLEERIYEGLNPTLPAKRRHESRWDYDAQGNRVGEARATNGASQWIWSFWTYDGDGNVLSHTDSLGATSTTTYGTTFNLYPVEQCNHLDHCMTFTWDDVLGRRLSDTDANGQTTSYVYDDLGRDREIHRPDGGVLEYEYLDSGNPELQRTRKIEPDGTADGLWTDVYQDGLGRTHKTIREGGLTQVTVYQNTLTRPWKESLWYGPGDTPRYIEHLYDASGRPRIARNPDLTESETWYGVDSNGFAIREVFDELDQKRRIWTDGLGRIVQVREWDDAGTPLDTTYSYDVIDRMLSSVDHLAKQSQHWWSIGGKKVASNTPSSGHWSYEYLQDSLVTRQTDARSRDVNYTYDVLGRIKTKTVQSLGVSEWFYDEPGHGYGIGRLSRVMFPGGSLSFVYDQLGRATSTTRCVDDVCKDIYAVYDEMDRTELVATLDPNIGFDVVTYSYDSSGRLDAASPYVTDMEWTAAGQLVSMTYANGTVTTYDYDEDREWLEEATVEDETGATLYRGVYEYDASARVDWMDVTRGAGGTTARWDYGYDALDRLTSLVGSGGAPSSGFSYDAMGNLLTKGTLPAYHYDSGNPYAVSRIGVTKYTYDASGNLVEKGTCNPEVECTSYTAQATYAFDADGRLSSFTNLATSQTTNYGYGPGEERVRIASPDGSVRRIFGPLLETLDAEGGDEVRFYYAGPIRVAMKDSSGTYFYHHDHLGSVRLMTDANGDQVATNDFLPFGERFAGTGSAGANPYDFAGHRTDAESGLVYMGARYYDPAIGRFISPDRVVPDILSPQSLNPYAYAYNNPISNVDPTGHAPLAIPLVLTIAASIGAGSNLVLQAVIWVGFAMSVAGYALKNPTLSSIGGIMLGFAGGYGLATGGLAYATGVMGASAAGLTSPISPLSESAQMAVGWAWTGFCMAVSIGSSIARQSAQQQEQLAKASAEAGQEPVVARGGSGEWTDAAVNELGGLSRDQIAGNLREGITQAKDQGYVWTDRIDPSPLFAASDPSGKNHYFTSFAAWREYLTNNPTYHILRGETEFGQATIYASALVRDSTWNRMLYRFDTFVDAARAVAAHEYGHTMGGFGSHNGPLALGYAAGGAVCVTCP